MSANADGVLSLVELVFRQRHEEVLACESVAVIGRGTSSKGQKPRMIALCRPFGAAAAAVSPSSPSSSVSQTTLNVLRVESDRLIKVKLVFVVARLVDVSHDGNFDATFNFGSSGMISVAFESHIQREMFVAAVRRVQRDLQPLQLALAPSGPGPAVQALLTDAVGAAVEADAAARVKGLRRARRRALSGEDERRLQAFLGPNGFDDVRSTELRLLERQKEAELAAVAVLLTSGSAWEAVRCRIADIITDVEELEGRIAQYSQHILSKKDQLQRIEHQNNKLQRKQRNLEKLHEQLEVFCGQLSLPKQTAALLVRLRSTRDEDLVSFFAEGNNAQVLSDAMKHMRALLHNTKLSTDYPIAAVAERRAFFTEQRRMIAHRSKAYILATISKHEEAYLAERTRYSGRGRVVWRMHNELMGELMSIRDMITALAHIDLEGYIAVLRRYRVSMQRVYALEVHRFFKYLRALVKKVGSRGPFLLGVRDSPDDMLATHMETVGGTGRGAGGTTPRHFLGGSLPSTPGASRAPSPRVRSDSIAHSNSSKYNDEMISLELPPSQDASLRLYDQSNVHVGTTSGASSAFSLASGFTGQKNGELRPDLALAMAIETTFTIVLQEEEIMRQCFGITEKEGISTENSHGGSTLLNTTALSIGEGDVSELLSESLLELFGGDKLVQFPSNKANSTPRVQGGETDFSGSRLAAPDDASHTSGNIMRRAQQRCFLQQQLVGFAEYCGEKCDRLYAVPVIVMVKAYLREGTRTASSSFCLVMLQALERIVASIISRSIAEQTASIAACRRRYLLHPAGMLSCFTKLPAFVQRMEVIHNALPPAICSRNDYASIALSFVDQSFEALNYITNLVGQDARRDVKFSLSESIAIRAFKLIDGVDNRSAKRGFIQQYRHHAFFCAFYASLQTTNCYAVDFLRERNESSEMLRDRYEEVYLTRAVLVKDFAEFGSFVLVAEDLARVHSREELRHHNALSVESVRRVLRSLPREMRNGIPSSSKRIKKHFLRDVAGQQEESFHCTLLQRLWQHFGTLLLQKIDFLEALLRWPMYEGIEMSVTRGEVLALLQEA
ncbi:Exocyst complex component Sec3 [Trypanosoma melophagium]|uniref:Exocyst complex component Sec3 n=1 Tax=Trypanosoma melophagium TaxID=715481 RepID=UPI003519FFC7|nr:Exocyst complex component Sec3 [Trypanosoma melophagium]